MKDETLLSDDLIHMAISAIEDLLDHCDPSTDHYCGVWADVPNKLRAALQSGNLGQPVTVLDESWRIEAEKQAEIYGQSFVVFRNGEQPQCADPTKVVISFTDKGLGHNAAPDGWIPVSERMPDFFYSVLVADEYEDMTIATPVDLSTGDRCAFRMSNGDVFLATHWQPLPDAPKVTP